MRSAMSELSESGGARRAPSTTASTIPSSSLAPSARPTARHSRTMPRVSSAIGSTWITPVGLSRMAEIAPGALMHSFAQARVVKSSVVTSKFVRSNSGTKARPCTVSGTTIHDGPRLAHAPGRRALGGTIDHRGHELLDRHEGREALHVLDAILQDDDRSIVATD